MILKSAICNVCLFFYTIFVTKFVRFGTPKGTKIDPKSTSKSTPVFVSFLISFLFTLGTLLGSFCDPFGHHLAAFFDPWKVCRPSWHLLGCLRGPQTVLGPIFGAFWIPNAPFWTHLEPFVHHFCTILDQHWPVLQKVHAQRTKTNGGGAGASP